MNTPKLIAFEGVDGAGKSTVIRHVQKALQAQGQTVYLPRQGKEHSSRGAREIRRLARDPRNIQLDPRTELLLYCAREAQVLREQVRPALARGEVVLLDRSLLTPVVLGAWGRGLDVGECEQQATWAAAGLEPDVTLIFDVHPRTSRIRKRLEKVRTHSRDTGGRKGQGGTGLKERVRTGYLELARKYGFPVFHVERVTPQELAQRVEQVLFGAATAEDLEGPSDAIPRWRVPAGTTLEQAFAQLPLDMALFLSNGLICARPLRQRSLETEAAVTAWSLDSEDPLRRALFEQEPRYALRGLIRRPLTEDDLRLRALSSAPGPALEALRHLTCAASDDLRRTWAEREPSSVQESLSGREDEFARQLRDELWAESTPSAQATSITFCSGKRASKLRRRLLEDWPVLGISSMRGVRSAEIDESLDALAPFAPKAVLRALAGRTDALATRLRTQLVETGRECIDSARGLDDDASWQLREASKARWPSTVIHSLGGLPPSERRDRLRRECAELGCEDVHTLRRLTGLDEFSQQPSWATVRIALERQE